MFWPIEGGQSEGSETCRGGGAAMLSGGLICVAPSPGNQEGQDESVFQTQMAPAMLKRQWRGRARPGEVTCKGSEATWLHLGHRDPSLHLRVCRLLAGFLYPGRLSRELLKSGNPTQTSGIRQGGRGREEVGRARRPCSPVPRCVNCQPCWRGLQPTLLTFASVIPPLTGLATNC